MSNNGCNGMHIGNIHVFTSVIGPLGAGMVSVFECKDTNNLAKKHLSDRKSLCFFNTCGGSGAAGGNAGNYLP